MLPVGMPADSVRLLQLGTHLIRGGLSVRAFMSGLAGHLDDVFDRDFRVLSGQSEANMRMSVQA
jgi:hypothetical protein